MATYNLGRILPRFRGQWDPTINYDKLDVVYFEGSSYMAMSDNINKRPDENQSDWMLSSAKGEPGKPGKDGPTYKAGKGINITNNVISAISGEGGESYFGGYGIEIDPYTNQINAEVRVTNDTPTEWENVTFEGLPADAVKEWDGRNVFYYKGSTYYSAGSNRHYRLDGLEWVPVRWDGFSDFSGVDIYVNSKGIMRYLSGNVVVRYDDEQERWIADSVNIPNPFGRYIYSGIDGCSYYMENVAKQYKIVDSSTYSTWTKINTGLDIKGYQVWSDENTTYFSEGLAQYYYDYVEDKWRTYKWRGLDIVDGSQIWHLEDMVLYSDGLATYLLENGDTWTRVSASANIFGDSIIVDSNGIYNYVSGHAKKLTITGRSYITRHNDRLVTEDELVKWASKLPKFTIKVVDELPTEDISDTTVYLLPSASATSGNLYDEYIYVNNKWEHLGSQNIDLKDYAKKSDIPTKLGDLENDVNYATQTWVNSQGYLKAVPSTYALKTEIPTKLSQLSNDANYVSRRSWTPIVGGTNKPSLNGYVIIGYVEHTPHPSNEWAVTINLYGGHNTLHGDTRIRIYATDNTATEIVQTPTVEFIHGGTSFPNVRLYRESATRISIGVYRHNNWTTATCELVNVTGTSFTAITTEEYKSADAEFLVQCKEMPKDTHTTSRREGVTKMFGFSFDDVHSRWQGAMFVVSSRDDSEENPIGLLIVQYGAYAKDGSLDRKNNCSFIRIAGGSNQIVSFFVDTNSLLNPVVYCNALYSATLRVTPIHNVKNFVLFDTVVTMPETNLLQVRDETLTDGLLSEDKAVELYQPKGNYLTEHQDISGKLDVSGSNGTADGVSTLINKLTTGTSTPNDADYYVCQYAGGGTSTTSYHRRPMSALWEWLKTKTDAEYKPTRWTPFVSSSSAPTEIVIIGTITHTPSLNKSWQISIRMLGKHGGTYYGDTTVRLSGVDSSTQVIIREISFVGGSISVPTVRAYRVSDTKIAIGVSKSNSWAGMDCIIENISETSFETSTAQEAKGWNESSLLECKSMPWERKSKAMKVVYEDGTEETINILYK